MATDPLLQQMLGVLGMAERITKLQAAGQERRDFLVVAACVYAAPLGLTVQEAVEQAGALCNAANAYFDAHYRTVDAVGEYPAAQPYTAGVKPPDDARQPPVLDPAMQAVVDEARREAEKE